ncbi:DUF397 domain-containing protein [Actinomadura barringtoniae]|uniref:DUF397 domain-containing protein n=1 Tax=Actinomadura barringtoniae TaxID=1427535 RepID=A0A939PG25_9ACTN|nr:DUF397 domain-containing protein [Actinomadura barringtoniae]MBO2452202.1 DUF397 domain-containing protein [Actinomadura barringtoniae]
MNHTPHWRKSSYSGEEGGSCIEVADLAPAVGVRDSKDKRADAPFLTLTTAQFGDLLKTIRAL